MIDSGLTDDDLSNYSNHISINSDYEGPDFRVGILCLHSNLIQL